MSSIFNKIMPSSNQPEFNTNKNVYKTIILIQVRQAIKLFKTNPKILYYAVLSS